MAPLEDESSGEEDTENHAAACAAVGFARSTRSPEALWVVTQETLYHDAARLDPAQAARRVRREDRRAAERIPRRSVVPPTDAGLRDALRAFDPSLLDEDAERSLCRECCQRVHDQGADPDAAGALHVAVALKSPRLVACLVDDCGADPNHRFDGATPLMNCAEGLSYSRCDFMRTGQVAELLLERGADAAATDLHGRTALGRLVDRMGGVDDERALFDRHRLGVPVFYSGSWRPPAARRPRTPTPRGARPGCSCATCSRASASSASPSRRRRCAWRRRSGSAAAAARRRPTSRGARRRRSSGPRARSSASRAWRACSVVRPYAYPNSPTA